MSSFKSSTPVLLHESGTPSRPAGIADRLAWLVDWLYPPRCRACGGFIAGPDAEYFCGACGSEIRLVSHPLCALCGRPFPDAGGDDHACGACLSRTPRFTSARAWACYPRDENDEDPLRRVIYRFKYGRKVSLGKPLGRLMAWGCCEFVASAGVDLIVPVPLHPKRLRWRGFNQSLLLAREVAWVHSLAIDPFILVRQRETVPQTQLTEEERRRNVRRAFSVQSAAALAGKTVLLVDDVYTSGATLDECSRALKRAGAAKVHVLTLARAV